MMSSDENGEGGPEEAWHRLEQKVDRVRTGIQDLASRESIRELREALDIERRARRHPYGMVAAALGVGFVLGGGLLSPLASRLVRAALRLGLRASALPFIENELVVLLTGAGGRRTASRARDERSRAPDAKGEVP
jgi:ElaB/YqjD/DUF883 family membrane-anchored ribosome-binding protein